MATQEELRFRVELGTVELNAVSPSMSVFPAHVKMKETARMAWMDINVRVLQDTLEFVVT